MRDEEGKGEEMVMEEDLTWGGEHKMQYTDYVLKNCTPEVYIIFINPCHPNKLKP